MRAVFLFGGGPRLTHYVRSNFTWYMRRQRIHLSRNVHHRQRFQQSFRQKTERAKVALRTSSTTRQFPSGILHFKELPRNTKIGVSITNNAHMEPHGHNRSNRQRNKVDIGSNNKLGLGRRNMGHGFLTYQEYVKFGTRHYRHFCLPLTQFFRWSVSCYIHQR